MQEPGGVTEEREGIMEKMMRWKDSFDMEAYVAGHVGCKGKFDPFCKLQG